ncbi:MAG: glycosyltransferase family 4 protein [Cyanobacteria bacterium P01_G01_bin.54]
MRILIYSYNYAPEPIGIGPLMTELAEGLAAQGHQIRVVTAFPWYPVQEKFLHYDRFRRLYLTERRNNILLQRCQVYRSKRRNLLNRGLFELSFMVLSFFQALRRGRPDVVLLTVPGLPVGLPAALIGWLFRCPIVLNLQDILPDAAIEVGLLSNPLAIFIFKRLEMFNYWIADRITVISSGFISNLQSKGVNLSKVNLIHNWVNVDFIKPIPPQQNHIRQGRLLQERFSHFLDVLGQTPPSFNPDYRLDDKFIVLYSGNIGLTQPMEKVIKAAKLLEALPQIHFVIVGPENGLVNLWTYCKKYNIKNNVTLSPFVDRADLPELMSIANVSLVVQKRNVISFNMPSKIQTISASGRPIIAAVPKEGTAAQAVLKSGGGVWIPPEDSESLAEAITHFYHHPEEAQRLGEKARRYAIEHYSYRRAIDRYAALFQDVCSPQSVSAVRATPTSPPTSGANPSNVSTQ